MPSAERLQEFVQWCGAHITGDEKGQAQIYRTFESPGANSLKEAHAALDTAVLSTYGFNAKRFARPNPRPEPGSRRED